MSRPGIDSQLPGERPPFALSPEERARREEQKVPFTVTFPDGSIGKFNSAEEAAEAMKGWREQ